MKAKILAFVLIAILIIGLVMLKITATKYLMKITDDGTQQQVERDYGNLPSAISGAH